MLAATDDDLGYAKSFLDDTATWCDQRVEERLVKLLEKIHEGDGTLFDPRERAARLAREFGRQVTVAGATATP